MTQVHRNINRNSAYNRTSPHIRDSSDDAAVLRQELVSVQRMMDEVTRKKESEVDDLRRRCETADRERELLQSSASEGQSELTAKVAGLEARNEEQARKKEELLEECNRLQKVISQLELEGKDLQHENKKVRGE